MTKTEIERLIALAKSEGVKFEVKDGQVFLRGRKPNPKLKARLREARSEIVHTLLTGKPPTAAEQLKWGRLWRRTSCVGLMLRLFPGAKFVSSSGPPPDETIGVQESLI